MNPFNVNIFFDLTEIQFKNIFNDIKDIWRALEKIELFINSHKTGIHSKVPSSCKLENKDQIHIAKNVLIEDSTYIKGPCFISEGSEIRQGAYLRGNVITGKNCIIGHTTEVKNSILLNNVHAAHFAYIGDSIIGNNVNLGAGVKLANFRLDQKEIKFSFNDKRVNTHLKKLGAIIGDNSQIGCNSVLNPATFLAKNVTIYSLLNIGGYILNGSIVKPSNKSFRITSKILKGLKDEIKSAK